MPHYPAVGDVYEGNYVTWEYEEDGRIVTETARVIDPAAKEFGDTYIVVEGGAYIEPRNIVEVHQSQPDHTSDYGEFGGFG